MSQTSGAPATPGGPPDAAPPPQAAPYPASSDAAAAAGVPASPIVPNTRTGVAWWSLGFSMLLLVVILVFVLQNLSSASANFFSVKWTIPLGLDLLLAALLGGLIVFMLGVGRMLQLRRLARRYARGQRRE